MYVSCDQGCIPLEGLGITPPVDAKELRRPEEKPNMEHSFREGVCPPEGDGVDESDRSALTYIGVPLEAVLRDLWTGGAQDA